LGKVTEAKKDMDFPTKKKSGITKPRPYTDQAKVLDAFKKKSDH
jgi:hypothetical protein